ncbi:hypothetical protein T484DRAFT_1742633 [Baffinella frigidus]|nr:hypothetical protein T484DRAFT_1742633 [Cryptophyta sp. CCMP2293]
MSGGKGGKNAAGAPPGKLPAKAPKRAKNKAAAAPDNSPGGSSAQALPAGGGYGMAGGAGYPAPQMNAGALPYDPYAGFPPHMAFNPMAFAMNNPGAPHGYPNPYGMPFIPGKPLHPTPQTPNPTP